MALPQSNISRTSNAGYPQAGAGPHDKWKRQLYAGKCKLCGNKSYGEHCKLCEYTLLQMDEIIKLYLEGAPPEDLDNAVVEFDRIYFSNLRIRTFYNTACEAIRFVIVNPNSPLILMEPNFSNIPEPKILAILEESKIITKKEENIYAGPLLEKLIRLRLTKYGISSPEFAKQLRIIYAVLTLVVTKTLLKHEEYIPQIVVGVFRVISAHVARNFDSAMIPKEITRSTWEAGLRGMNPREEVHLEWDLLGLTANTNPRIFDDYDAELEQFISKPCMLNYYEYVRNIIRERQLERDR
ncbi:MAG: hypothetical protein ABSD73_06610 [Candidatus Bathyarchaeia archaeon]